MNPQPEPNIGRRPTEEYDTSEHADLVMLAVGAIVLIIVVVFVVALMQSKKTQCEASGGEWGVGGGNTCIYEGASR